MLPLQSPTPPASAAALQAALTAGLQGHGLTPRSLEVTSGAWPAVEKLDLDLTGARATRDLRLPADAALSGPEIPVAELSIHAEPLLLESTPLTLQLHARAAVFTLGEVALTLLRSGPGRLSASLLREDLRKLALEAARAAGQAHGAQILDLQLDLQAEGPRALRFSSEVTAKMGFLKATLTLTGQAELDDQLRLRLSHLDLKGQGMASTVAAGFIRPQLEKVQRAPIPLSMLNLGEVRLRDLQLTTGETIQAEAAFSS